MELYQYKHKYIIKQIIFKIKVYKYSSMKIMKISNRIIKANSNKQ